MRKLAQKKILVIDDDDAVRKWIALVLTKEGYDCHEAGDGNIGASIAEIFNPDVILCDIEMPGIDGYAVFKRLSENPKTALIPFIFVTGRNLREDIRKGMSLGADDYLIKPMAEAELVDSVRARLIKKQLQDRQGQKKIQRARDAVTREISYCRLTHLPNRQLLLKQFLEMNESSFLVDSFAVLSLGMDNLRDITEAFGSRCEEIVLRAVVRRLNRHLDSGAMLYRGKHDSFDVLIRNTKDKNKLEALMKEIIHALSASFSYKNQMFRIKVSIGCTFYEQQSGAQVETILNRAETARHYARKEAEKGYRFYIPEMQKSVVDRMTLENHLYKALKNNELSLCYQPQLDIQGRQIHAVEALLRWHNSKLGMIAPLQFIPLAEVNGLILPIGKWVLEESCRQLKEWQQAGLDLRMAVNISRRQLEEGDLAENVEEILGQSGVRPSCLELEITESLWMKNLSRIQEQIKVLKNTGVMIAIDDFGTGYSSLASLKKIPFDTLKIDRSFITDIETHASNTEIVGAIIKMSKTLKLKTVAEGVETQEQLDCLKTLNCDEFQGYLFSRPVPAPEIPPLLEKFKRAGSRSAGTLHHNAIL